MCDICQSFPCLPRCPNFDNYKSVGRCANCGDVIYSCYEFYTDKEKNLFCTEECAIDFYGIKNAD